MRGLKGKVAVVTGGLGDLGYATAKRLIEEGVRVAIIDLKADDGRGKSLGAECFSVDITDDKALAKTFDTVAQRLGDCSILVNSAAFFLFKGLEATLEDFQKACSVNIAGMSLVTKHAVEHMKRVGHGSVINFSSISGFITQPRFSTYSSTKFAIRGLTRCWAQDLAPLKIRVNSLCPGYIYTDAFVNSCKALGYDLDQENARVSALNLLNRQGRPEEVASVAAFLASDDSTYVTGSDLMVDGGYTAL